MTTSYTAVFGGQVVIPADQSYISYTLNSTTPSITLTWPSQFVDTANYVSNIIEVTSDIPGRSLVMPNATLVSVGQSTLINNVGSNSVNIYATDGTTLITTIAGVASTYIYLINNSTANGLWRNIPWGGGSPAVVNINAVSLNPDLTVTGGPITSAGTFTFNLTGDIGSITNIVGNGIIVKVGTGNWVARTIQGTANQITVVNGDGVAGNPVISLPAAVSGITSLVASNIRLGVSGANIIDSADGNPIVLNDTTTITPTAGVANALRFFAGNAAHYLGLAAPAIIGASVNWLLPPADGTAGQVLSTDGAGNLNWSNAGAGTVNSVSGTLNRITSTGGTNPIIDIAATYVGQASITTVGTIGTGVWQGTPVVVSFGGTGGTTYSAYSVICAGTIDTGPFQHVSGTGTAGFVLTSNGAGALPTWQISPSGLVSFTYYTTGSGTYTPPANVKVIMVELVGGGGGGGGAASAAAHSAAAGGGGAGGYGRVYIASPAASYAYAVGAGGTGGVAANGNGVAGGNTTFGIYTAGGGGGGFGGSSTTGAGGNANGGSGGTVTGFDLNVGGRNGYGGLIYVAGSTAQGGQGGETIYGYPGTPGFAVGIDSGAGDGFGYGGGGGGAASNGSAVGAAGGAGTEGIIIIWQFS